MAPSNLRFHLAAVFCLAMSGIAGCQSAPASNAPGLTVEDERTDVRSGTSLNETIRGVLAAPDTHTDIAR
jgi:hypothetical protein